MQTRLLFVAFLAMSVALAGCADDPTGSDDQVNANGTTRPGDDAGRQDDARPPPAMTNAEAQALFSSAAGGAPEHYGMRMEAKNATLTVMTAEAVYDETAQTAYFRMEMDPSVFEDMGEGMTMGGDPEAFRNMGMYMSPQGNAFVVNDTVMLSKAEEGQFAQAAGDNEGFAALSDPDSFIGDLNENNFTVHKVTPTTLRGKGALKLDATIVEEGVAQNMSVWLFQQPTRVARIETQMPNDDDDAKSPFHDATMTIDMLYDSEVTLTIPDDLKRALGLRYESDREPFSFGGDDGPETWTFMVDGGIGIGELQAEVGSFGDDEPEWTMLLSESPKTKDGVTVTFHDVDADGKLSANDTLVILRSDEAMMGSTVTLRDNETGLRVVPGFGVLLAVLALAGALALTRRRA